MFGSVIDHLINFAKGPGTAIFRSSYDSSFSSSILGRPSASISRPLPRPPRRPAMNRTRRDAPVDGRHRFGGHGDGGASPRRADSSPGNFLDLVGWAGNEGRPLYLFDPVLPDRRQTLRGDAPPSVDSERISRTDWGVSTRSAEDVWTQMAFMPGSASARKSRWDSCGSPRPCRGRPRPPRKDFRH